MAIPAGALFDLHSQRIEEVINKNIDIILPTLHPIWAQTVTSSQGVGSADAIGRDMNILKVFTGSMTGVLEQAKPRNDFVLYGDDTDALSPKINTQNVVQAFPDPTQGANASPYRLGIPMRAMVSNIMLTLGELTAEALPAFIGEVIGPKLEGFARNISHQLCNYWHISQNNNYSLGTILTSTAGSPSAFGAGFLFSCTITEQVSDRFYTGQMVDFYDALERQNDTQAAVGNQTLATRIPCFVHACDPLTNTVWFTTSTTPSGWAGAVPALNHTIHYSSDSTHLDGSSALGFTGIAGVNSWLKSGADTYNATPSSAPNNFLLGSEALASDAIDVSRDHPEHKSFTKDLLNTPLTEHKLRQYLRRLHCAKLQYGYSIDTLIASDGVWLAYEATKIGREILDRTGRLSSLRHEGSDNTEYGGFNFTMDGRNYTGYTSPYVEGNTVYGIKLGGGNWKRYVPPEPQGTERFSRADGFIPFSFVGGALAGTSKLPVYLDSTTGGTGINQVTEAVQMPGMLRMQLVPDQPCGLKLTNVSEDRQYSDN